MIISNKRYCDECHSNKAYRYYIGWTIRDLCENCALKYHKIF